MPSAAVRFAGEAAFLVLVALGLGLAEFDPIVIAVVMFVAWVLVALLERASAKEAARVRLVEEAELVPMPPTHVERVEVEPAAAEEPESAAEPEPVVEPTFEPAVDERSARAILASAPPPLPPESAKQKPKRVRRAAPRPTPPKTVPPPPPSPEPESEPVVSGPPREWNLWELQRAVRDLGDDARQEEWTALLIHLREFANADGDLPIEFDSLVREAFEGVLAEQNEAAAAP